MNAPFLSMIQLLRKSEEVLLFGNVLQFSEAESRAVIQFLKEEYEKEALDFPYGPPPFDAEAALWAAKTVYLTAQLLLYRQNKIQDIESLMPAYQGSMNAPAFLSADLTLRFLPHLLIQLQLIDPDDQLIPLLEKYVRQWHYSGIGYLKGTAPHFLKPVLEDPCFLQLYVNRIIKHKDLALAKHQAFHSKVSASLGIFAGQLWKEYLQEPFENEPD